MSPDSGKSEVVVVDSTDILLGAMTFIMMLATVGLLVFTVFTLNGDARQAETTRHAVCTFRQTLLDQVRSTSNYLHKHPDGAPALGISAKQLEDTLRRQRAAYDSLSDLNCTP